MRIASTTYPDKPLPELEWRRFIRIQVQRIELRNLIAMKAENEAKFQTLIKSINGNAINRNHNASS